MAAQKKARTEKFERTRPDGTVVVVERNIDTGEQSVTEKKETKPAAKTPAKSPAQSKKGSEQPATPTDPATSDEDAAKGDAGE